MRVVWRICFYFGCFLVGVGFVFGVSAAAAQRWDLLLPDVRCFAVGLVAVVLGYAKTPHGLD